AAHSPRAGRAGLRSTRQILSSAAPSESEATFRIHFPFVSNDLQKPTCDSPALCPRAQPPDRGPNISDSNHVIRKKRRRPRTCGGPRHVGRFTLTPAVRTYP